MHHLRTIAVALAAMAALIVAAPSARAAPQPTPGCSADRPRLPEAKYTEANWPITQTEIGGRVVKRTFNVFVPGQHTDTAREPLPLVIDLHGSNFDNLPRPGQVHDAGSLMSRKGTAAGFIVAQPDSSPFPTWAKRQDVSDVKFLEELLDVIADKLCFDRNRVFVSGGSNGGTMAAELTCEAANNRFGHKIAAIAPVVMAPGIPWFTPAQPICPELRQSPVPTRVIVSNKDHTLAIAFFGDVGKLNQALRTAVGTWARDNGCAATSARAPTGQSGCEVLSETVTYACAGVGGGRADTVLDVFDSTPEGCKGHVWPGKTAGTYQATEVILRFFLDHPR
jgi:poly(3-hydroxybutyrate) depolymerase